MISILSAGRIVSKPFIGRGQISLLILGKIGFLNNLKVSEYSTPVIPRSPTNSKTKIQSLKLYLSYQAPFYWSYRQFGKPNPYPSMAQQYVPFKTCTEIHLFANNIICQEDFSVVAKSERHFTSFRHWGRFPVPLVLSPLRPPPHTPPGGWPHLIRGLCGRRTTCVA